ncbi:MAG: phage tail protein [Candidatus Bathyarchaeia archaeon]
MTLTQRSSGIIYSSDLSSLGNWKTTIWDTPNDNYSLGTCTVPGFFETTAFSNGNAWALFYACFEAYAYFYQSFNLGTGAVFRLNYKTPIPPAAGRSNVAALKVGSTSFGTVGEAAWTGIQGTLPGGTQQIQIGYAFALSPDTSGQSVEIAVEDLLIYSSNNVTITGLAGGQKVSLYTAGPGGGLVGSATCAGNATSVVISLASVWAALPAQIYAMVYAADGSTLVEQTQPQTMCGGDVWNWTPLQTLSLTVDNFQIYQKNAPSKAQPTTAVITATLINLATKLPYPSKTINFSTSLGTLSAASATTSAAGLAVVSLTSTTPGLAVVQATWTGDATVGAATGFVNVHVFYDAEGPDETQPFQLYVEGCPYSYVGGTGGTSHYGQNYQQKIETFTFDLPRYYPTLTPRGIVRVYRYGVLEYAGLLEDIKRTIGSSYKITLSGSDASKLLDTRIIQEAEFLAASPEFIINSLLTNYQCGIMVGQLGTTGITLPSVLFTDVTLRAAIQQVCGLIGWTYRVNPNLTLDFASQFGGGTSNVAFNEGDTVGDSTSELDFSTMGNRMYLVGNGIVSIQSDSDSINKYGLIEQVAFQKTVTDATTLAIACQAMLADSENTELIAQITVRDTNPPDTFGPEDSITVNIPDLGLAGLYTVVRIQRDLSDPTIATIDLNRRMPQLWELDETSSRMLSDLSAGITLAA